MSEMVPCRLCGKRMTLRTMQKHMGHHHEQLALFAIPPNLDDTEEDHEEDLSSVSNNDDAGTDEEKTEDEVNDVNDDSELDEIVDESSLPGRFPGAMADETQHFNDTRPSPLLGSFAYMQKKFIVQGLPESEPNFYIYDPETNDRVTWRDYHEKLRDKLVSCNINCTL